MSLPCFEITWLIGLHVELNFSVTNPTTLHYNNISAI